MKEFMDKAQTAYAEGNYVECEAYAKKASEIDPNEVAAIMMVFKAKTERRYKQDLETKAAKENGVATAFQEIDVASIMDPEVQINGIKYAKNFKDLTRERLRTERPARAQERPQGAGDRVQAQGPDHHQPRQAASVRGDHVPCRTTRD